MNTTQHWVSLNGVLMRGEEARVSVFDSGFMQGIGLFETMRSYAGRVFRLERHLDRLIDSARALGWTVMPDADELRENVQQVLSATTGVDTRVRLTVTTGSLHVAATEVPELTVVASAAPGQGYPDELYTAGVTVAISKYRQHASEPTAGHKTTSYFSRLAALRQAHAAGAFESLWFTVDTRLAEGSISSVFLVQNEQLLTPPLETPVLPGITRATVLELAQLEGIAVQERPITLDELLAADEVFLTNSMMELVPVVRIEREPVGTEKPGEITKRLAVAYSEQIEKECAGDEGDEDL